MLKTRYDEKYTHTYSRIKIDNRYDHSHSYYFMNEI